MSTFIGRSAARAAVADLIAKERLVTLCGPPGVGKTRLALEVASAEAARKAGRTWWVDLATVSEPDGVVPGIARVLGVHTHSGRPLIDALVLWLRDQQALVVLDNCEHLATAARDAAAALLEDCGDLRILATSRQPLGLAGERRVEVGPLPVPEAGAGVADVAASEAGQLFCARASAVYPMFELGPQEAVAIGDICRRLDGIPLAIELAAGRIGVLSPTEIAARLSDRFSVLGGVPRSFNSRHRTLAEALDWSYELLSTAEQALLRRLGIFPGEFDFAAAEAVCPGGDVGPAALLDLLAGLVAKSLVVATTSPTPARYRLLETVRAYAAERLAATDEADDLADRHAQWYLRLAEEAERELTGPRQRAWLHHLDAEYPNLSQALRWLLVQGRAEDPLRMAGALIFYWRLRGQFDEGRRWLAAALKQSQEALPSLRGKALWGIGLLSLMCEEAATAEQALAESMDVFNRLGDATGLGRVLLVLGNCRLDTTGAAAAQEALDQSVALARQAQDEWCLAHALSLAGRGRIAAGDVETGRTMLEEALLVAERSGDDQGRRIAQAILAQLAVTQGDLPRARRLAEASLSICTALRDPYGVSAALLILGNVATVEGRYDLARSLLEESSDLSRRMNGSGAAGLEPLMAVALAQGDLEYAGHLIGELMDDDRASRAPWLLSLAELALASGDLESARQHLDHKLVTEEVAAGTLRGGKALHASGRLSRLQGEGRVAESRHSQALALRLELGDLPGVAQSLESLAALAAAGGDGDRAARLWGAAESIRQTGGFVRPPVEQTSYDEDIAAARAISSVEEFEAAWREGASLTAAEAAAYALRGRGRRATRPEHGWKSLTPAELQVAHLVAEGLTNGEIAERRFVTVSTVKDHVQKLFVKLSVKSRVDVAKEVLRRTG